MVYPGYSLSKFDHSPYLLLRTKPRNSLGLSVDFRPRSRPSLGHAVSRNRKERWQFLPQWLNHSRTSAAGNICTRAVRYLFPLARGTRRTEQHRLALLKYEGSQSRPSLAASYRGYQGRGVVRLDVGRGRRTSIRLGNPRWVP